MKPTIADTPIQKLYFSSKEAAKEIGCTLGLIYIYARVLQIGNLHPEGSHGHRFSRKEVEKLKAEIR